MSGNFSAYFSSLSASKVRYISHFLLFLHHLCEEVAFFPTSPSFYSLPLHCSYKSRLHPSPFNKVTAPFRLPPSFFSTTTANIVHCLFSSPFTLKLLPPLCNPLLFFRFHTQALPPLCKTIFSTVTILKKNDW